MIAVLVIAGGGTYVLRAARQSDAALDVWVSPLTGGTPRLLVPDADSPAAVRP